MQTRAWSCPVERVLSFSFALFGVALQHFSSISDGVLVLGGYLGNRWERSLCDREKKMRDE